MAKILKSSIPYKQPVSENLVEFIKIGLRKNANEIIIIDSESDRTWTGAELERQISVVAKFLKDKCKLEKGDVCTVYGKTNDQVVILLLAVISAGGVCNFLSSSYRAREVVDTSRPLGFEFLISTKILLDSLKDYASQLEKVRLISYDQSICDGSKDICCTLGPVLLEKCQPNCKANLDELIDETNYDVNKDFAVIQFSSGTTGKPKPIPRTHKNLCHLVASVDHEELMNLKPGQVIAGALPITHRPGLWALLACINSGGTFVLWDKTSDINDALRIIEKYKVTILSCALTFLGMLGNIGIKLKDKFNLTSLEQIITSGAKIVHSDLPNSLVKEFKLKTLRQCFGMTESGWVFLIENSLAKDNYLSVGHVVPGTEMVILDRDTLKPIGVEVRGELALRGPQVFPGYLTDKTDVYNRSDFTDDGWFRAGDQAYYDKDELVFIEGRFKELLIFPNSGRFFPNEIETIISEHPAIESSCVVKVGEVQSYDIARAFVTLKQDCKVTEKELLEFIKERSYEATLDGGIRILDKFPRLTNGKVDKQLLKKLE